MIIGACGYGGTGSSAVIDYLSEFKGIQIMNRSEIQYAFKVDGLQDLEYHLVKRFSRQMSGDQAIKRFVDASKYANTPIVKKPIKCKKEYLDITNEYINSLVQATWLGIDNADFETKHTMRNLIILIFKKIVIPNYEKLTGKLYSLWPMRTMYLCIQPDDFYRKTRKYTHQILKAAGADFTKKIVLDQPFEGNDPTQSFPFYDNPKAIVIDRDPRDLYLAASYQWKKDGTFMPRRDPRAFVEYYKKQRVDRATLNYKNDVLYMNLEDLIFDYDEKTKYINDFLNLDENDHADKLKFFNPQISIKGTQLYKKLEGHKDEIAYIEKNLEEYLFPFEQYDMSQNNTEIFYADDENWSS